MKCMKCGVSIPASQVFCDSCLADMAAHPVKQDAPLLLPRREKQTTQKRNKRRVRKPEEQITTLRNLVTTLLMIILALCIALTITIHMLYSRGNVDDNTLQPGQNYGTSEQVN